MRQNEKTAINLLSLVVASIIISIILYKISLFFYPFTGEIPQISQGFVVYLFLAGIIWTLFIEVSLNMFRSIGPRLANWWDPTARETLQTEKRSERRYHYPSILLKGNYNRLNRKIIDLQSQCNSYIQSLNLYEEKLNLSIKDVCKEINKMDSQIDRSSEFKQRIVDLQKLYTLRHRIIKDEIYSTIRDIRKEVGEADLEIGELLVYFERSDIYHVPIPVIQYQALFLIAAILLLALLTSLEHAASLDNFLFIGTMGFLVYVIAYINKMVVIFFMSDNVGERKIISDTVKKHIDYFIYINIYTFSISTLIGIIIYITKYVLHMNYYVTIFFVFLFTAIECLLILSGDGSNPQGHSWNILTPGLVFATIPLAVYFYSRNFDHYIDMYEKYGTFVIWSITKYHIRNPSWLQFINIISTNKKYSGNGPKINIDLEKINIDCINAKASNECMQL
jgi:hypothetical protein